MHIYLNDLFVYKKCVGLYTWFAHHIRNLSKALLSFFEHACHNLDLKLAMNWKVSPMEKSQYYVYSQTLKDLDSALIELEQLAQVADSVQQLATYYAIVAVAVTPIVEKLLELSVNCFKRFR